MSNKSKKSDPAVAPAKSKMELEVDSDFRIHKNFVWNAWTEIYGKTIDLPAFIKHFANFLANNNTFPFRDSIRDTQGNRGFLGGQADGSAFMKPTEHQNRTGNMFEKKSMWAKYPGYNECEFHWEAMTDTKFSSFGYVVFKMNMVCRRIVDVEVVVDGKKKIMQKGDWEFRNTLIYYNHVIPEFIHPIPFVKHSPEAQRLIIDHIYYPNIKRDFDYVEFKILPFIWAEIHKVFRD